MSGECDKCGEHTLECGCNSEDKYIKWHNLKVKKPPFGEVVEVINPKGLIYSNIGRDYFALVTDNDEIFWMTPSLSDMDYKEVKITHWRHIPPDPTGKKPFIKLKKSQWFYEPEVYFVKLK